MTGCRAGEPSLATSSSDGAPLCVPALALEGFGFSYPDGERVFEDASMQVPEGALALLVGPTGSGKTTLLRCAKEEVAPHGERRGSLRVFGRPPDAKGASSDVGSVFQDPEAQIVCDSVIRELAFGLECSGCEKDEMGRRMAEIATFFGMESWLHERTAHLSGGRKQVLCVASVVAMQPRLLLLDEPSEQMDPVTRASFMHLLFRLNRELGITIIVATHDPTPMLPYATCSFLIENRCIVEKNDGHLLSVPKASRTRVVASALEDERSPIESAQPTSLGTRDLDSPAVALRDVSFRYDRHGREVLDGLSTEVPRGSVLSIVGGNGGGKTTLLKVMAGILRPQRGHAIRPLGGSQAYLPQEAKLLFSCETVEEELDAWRGRRKRLGDARSASIGTDAERDPDARVERMLARFGLSRKRRCHPLDLSGGEQQCLAIAKLLLLEPAILLLDEPARGLDTDRKVQVGRILRALAASGTTIVAVTHDLAFADRVSDAIAMVFDGRIAALQSPQRFSEDAIFYRPVDDAFTMAWDEVEG